LQKRITQDLRKMPDPEITPALDATHCPVCGLPLHHRPEWTHLALSSRCHFSTALIGERIIYNQPVGHATKTTLKKALDLTDVVCAASIPAGLSFVYLFDYRQVLSISPRSRKYFHEYLQAKKRLGGVIIFGASPLVRMAIKLDQKLGRYGNVPLFVVPTYTDAVNQAIELVGRLAVANRVGEDDNRQSAQSSSQQVDQERHRPIRIQQLWRREIEGFRDQLLSYLGDMDWGRSDLQAPPAPVAEGPLGPVWEALGLLKAALDEVVAERQAVAEALKQSQQRFQEVMAYSRDLLFKRKIATGTYEYISAAAEELIGYSADEVRTMGIDGVIDLMHPDDRQRFESFCAGLLTSAEDLPREHLIEYRLRHKNGRYIWFSDSHAILRDEAGRPTHVIGSNRDIQRSKAMEAERLRMTKRLQQSRKLEAISTLAGGIAHNFNNLLMTILGNAEMARMQLAPESEINPRIEAIQKAGDRAAELSTLMLTYVGQSKMSFDTLDLSVLASEMAQILKTSMPHSDQLKVSTSEAQTCISGDPGKIGQVITDVVTNAIEATFEDTRQIILKTGRRNYDATFFEKRVFYETLPSGEYVYLEISDNGSGMDLQTLEKVFDPFFTTKFTGRGLGLAAAVGIIRAHKGTIALSSNPKRGTTVTLLFPPATAPAVSIQARPAATRPLPDVGNTVLLVDDEPMVIEVGEMMLEAIGFDVVTARDGIEGLDQLKHHRGKLTLVILDLTMPRKDGFETFREMQAMAPEIPVIIATGYTRGQVRQQFADTPPAAYLKKPFRMDQLADTIRGVLSAAEDPSPKSPTN
jgi:PAS domain S-box-containing protein